MARRLYLDTSESNFISLTSNNADSSWILPDITSLMATHYSVELIDCSIPVTQHCFVSGVNTTFKFTENSGAVQTFEITAGTYTGSEIASHLATKLTSTSGVVSYSGSFSDITKKITLITTIPDDFTIESTSTCLKELGFTAANATTAVSQISVNVVNLLGTRYLDLVVNFNTHSVAPNGKMNILHRVHIDQPVGGVVFYNNNFSKGMVTINSESIRQLEIRLYDENNTLYTIPDNHRVSYTLLLTPLD